MRKKRWNKMKVFLKAVVACVLFANAGCQWDTKKSDTAEEGDRPNILFAIADDASWKHFGAYGTHWVKTPAFDRVARNGILFTRAYTPNAKCSPSRACILTGRNSWQLEEAANHSPEFPKKYKTYAEALRANGYWVGSTGKGWAPGEPGKIDGKERELTGPKFDEYKTSPPSKYISPNDYAKNFEAFLKDRPEGNPFCFWYGSREPHRAYEYKTGIKKGKKKLNDIIHNAIPEFWPDTDTVRTDMLDYAFEVEYFDKQLQKMLSMLEEKGELENTIVIVTADNGMPFPRIKGDVYEYSNHLPLAIMWPNGIKSPGRKVKDFVSFIDFAPTILDVANLTRQNAKMQPIAGKSLTNIFYDVQGTSQNPNRKYVLVGKERHDVGRPNDEGYPVRGIVSEKNLYLRNYKTKRWPKGNPETGYLNTDGSPTKTYILNTRRNKGILKYWKLNFGKRPAEEFYNIAEDPYCMINLAEDPEYKTVIDSLKEQMNKLLILQKDPRIMGDGDIFDNYPYSGKEKNYYNRYMSGENVPAGWVKKSDYDEYLLEK